MCHFFAQVVGNDAKCVSTPEEQRELVVNFCTGLRSIPAYKHALFVVMAEANNNAIEAVQICKYVELFGPAYFLRRADLEPRHKGNGLVQTTADIAKQSLMTEGAGVFLGVGILTKTYNVMNMQNALKHENICRATHLVGFDAEKTWKEFLRELESMRSFVEASKTRPDKQHLVITGKRSGSGRDDLATAGQHGLSALVANLNNQHSALKQHCESLSLDWQSD